MEDKITNQKIAQILREIANILELENESPFRIRAYQTAARSIDFLEEGIWEIYKNKGLEGLKEIQGVGESIALKIEELLKTGHLKYFEEIKKKVAPQELELTQIPGIGPKLAQRLFEKLKVESIDDLGEKLKEISPGQLDDIHLKEKSILKILKGIEVLRKIGTRKLLPFAEPIARDFVQRLKALPEVKKADPVGSLRRMKETVGDIDIIATSSNPFKTIERFVSFPGIAEIIAKGEKKVTLIHKENIQIDLEILPEKKYGSLLQHFTGSKEHNIALRTWAESKGFSISEHGIKIKGKLKYCPEEEDVYHTLGMDWIPPELRENRGEIKAALNRSLPNLVKLEDIKGDLHIHTNWSDGGVDIEDMVRAAAERGWQYLAISDHTKGLGVAGGLDEEKILNQIEEIKKVQKHNPGIKILSGTEVNIMADGSLDLPDFILEKLDIVIASVHSALDQPKERMTERILTAIGNPNVRIFGHPSGRLLEAREESNIDWPRLFKTAAEKRVALEINAFPDRLDLKDNLCQEAKKYGIKFVINTDSHYPIHLDLIRYGVAVARRGWLGKKDILNTLSWEELEKWLKRERRVV